MIHKFEDSKIIYKTVSSTGRLLFQSDSLDYVQLTISVKSKIETHTIDIQIDFYVIEGNGILKISGNTFNLKNGDMISVPPNLERSWENNNDKELMLLGIKHK